MSLRYLLDTNIVSAPIRPDPPEALLQRLRADSAACAIGVPTWQELRYGHAVLPDSRRKEALGRYLKEVVLPSFPILPVDRAAAEWHAEERARLRQLGRDPPFVDGQLAAIAAVNGLVMVTHNVDDFSRFRNLEVEDWLT